MQSRPMITNFFGPIFYLNSKNVQKIKKEMALIAGQYPVPKVEALTTMLSQLAARMLSYRPYAMGHTQLIF